MSLIAKEKEKEASKAQAKRLAEAKRLAQEAQAKRLAEEAEAKRLAQEAQAKHLAEEPNRYEYIFVMGLGWLANSIHYATADSTTISAQI